MDKFIVNIIHRPEMVPEYSATVTGQGKEEEANSYFTAAVLFTCIFSLIIGILGAVFWRPIAYLGGADDSIIELVGQYLRILNGGAILFVVNNFLGVFIRNDHDPQRVMAAGIVSCLLNIVLDYAVSYTHLTLPTILRV